MQPQNPNIGINLDLIDQVVDQIPEWTWPVLTEANILEIRRLAFDNQTYVQISKRFGIHKDTVYRIIKRKSWTHV
jgi:hypothetical protein